MRRHVENISGVYGLPTVVAINRFPTDTDKEIAALEAALADLPCRVILSDVWAKGGLGAIELAEEVVRLCEEPARFTFAYPLEEGGIEDKIRAVATRIYGADDIVLEEGVSDQIARLERDGYAHVPVCMAKTQYSFSDNAALLGAPTGFKVSVKGVKVSAGAGFVVVYTGNIMTMPGLPKVPAANHIDVSSDGVITGLF